MTATKWPGSQARNVLWFLLFLGALLSIVVGLVLVVTS